MYLGYITLTGRLNIWQTLSNCFLIFAVKSISTVHALMIWVTCCITQLVQIQAQTAQKMFATSAEKRKYQIPCNNWHFGWLVPVVHVLHHRHGLPERGLPGRGLPGRGLPGRGLPGHGLPGRDLPNSFGLCRLGMCCIPRGVTYLGMAWLGLACIIEVSV